MRQNLIEIGANLMMAQSGRALSPASPPARLHLEVLTLSTLLFHFIPDGSMQSSPPIRATLILNPTFDMHRCYSILILCFSCLCPPSSSLLLHLPNTSLIFLLLFSLSSSRMDITPTGQRRKIEWTATTRTLCPKTLRT